MGKRVLDLDDSLNTFLRTAASAFGFGQVSLELVLCVDVHLLVSAVTETDPHAVSTTSAHCTVCMYGSTEAFDFHFYLSQAF